MPRRTFLLVTVALILAAALVFAAYWEATCSGNVTSTIPSKFTANGKTFLITDFATTNAQREKGLMNRVVGNPTIMLFVFPQRGVYSFWMFDTNTSLDMVWVDATGDTGRVVYIVAYAPPCYIASSCIRYTPSSPSNYVIETKAGFASTNGISVNGTIKFS